MTINNPSISTSDNESGPQAWRIEMVDTLPEVNPNYFIEPPVAPNRVYGWYNGASNMVELFMTNSAGNGYIRLGTFNE